MKNVYNKLVVKNVKQLPEAEKLVQQKGLTREDLQLILSTFKLRDEKAPQVAGTTSEDSGSFIKTNVTTYRLEHDVCSLLTLNIAISADGSHLSYANEILM